MIIENEFPDHVDKCQVQFNWLRETGAFCFKCVATQIHDHHQVKGTDEYSYMTKILLNYKLTFGIKIITKYKVFFPNTTPHNSYSLTIGVLCINRKHSVKGASVSLARLWSDELVGCKSADDILSCSSNCTRHSITILKEISK